MPESAVGDEIAAAVDNLIGVVHAHHIPEKFKYFHCTTMTEVKAQTDHVLALIAKAIAAAKVKLDATVREQIRLLTDDNVALRKERDEARAEVERLKAGGCARDQRTTQFCAEAVALQRENERLRNDLAAQDRATKALVQRLTGGDHGK